MLETQALQPCARGVGELAVPLDRVDLASDPAEHRCRVAGPGADLQDAVRGLRLDRLRQQGDYIGLRDRLPLGDWQRRVVVRPGSQLGRHERFPRHPAHRVRDPRIAYAPCLQLTLHHLLAPALHFLHAASVRTPQVLPRFRAERAPVCSAIDV
jgi:hypothetical protein